ncbi:MAG: NTP transferase domain-containing protein [Bifidobacteriaceae bacterium]|nr:NTP transferase domain-containing protein [Bifidobacteriaceae bacterium]
MSSIKTWAIILAGGRSRRLAGRDKAGLRGPGGSLLEQVVRACRPVDGTVIVGPVDRLGTHLAWPPEPSQPIWWTCESPRWGGPARGLAAGLDRLAAGAPRDPGDLVIVAACDLPRAEDGIGLLRRRAESAATAGVVAQTPGGRIQWLFGVWRFGPLAAACAGLDPGGSGESARALLEPLGPVRLRLSRQTAQDIDTWRQAEALGYH